MTESFVRSRRCDSCRLPREICICDEIPRIDLPFEVVVIQHYRERDSQSNTGRLVHRALSPSRLVVHGAPERSPSAESIWEPETDYHVLFPLGDASTTLASDSFSERSERRQALVVLDGKWRQARRMSRRVPGIRAWPFVALPERSSTFDAPLRRSRVRAHLGTGEAVARALEVLGHAEAARRFSRALDLLVSRVLLVRGRIPRNSEQAGLTDEQRESLERSDSETSWQDDTGC